MIPTKGCGREPDSKLLSMCDRYLNTILGSGFLVTTMAGREALQARNNDVKYREQALSSGAFFIFKDYALPHRRF